MSEEPAGLFVFGYGAKRRVDCSTGEVIEEALTIEQVEIRDAEREAAKLAAIRYSISPDSVVIVADGIDAAVFVVTGDPAQATVNINIGGMIETIEMTAGRGEFEVVSEQAGVIVVRGEDGPLADCVAKVYAAEAVTPPPGDPIL